MSLLTICTLVVGLWVIIVSLGVSALIVAGKSDEKLGYNVPYEELIPEPDDIDTNLSFPQLPHHEPPNSKGYGTYFPAISD